MYHPTEQTIILRQDASVHNMPYGRSKPHHGRSGDGGLIYGLQRVSKILLYRHYQMSQCPERASSCTLCSKAVYTEPFLFRHNFAVLPSGGNRDHAKKSEPQMNVSLSKSLRLSPTQTSCYNPAAAATATTAVL